MTAAFPGAERATARMPKGGALFRRSLAAGVAGLALTWLGGIGSPRTALASYLVAYTYWVGIAVGALLLLSTFHAASARWVVVVRRLLESMASTLTFFALLFVPLALKLQTVFFAWAAPDAIVGHGLPELVRQKHEWLSPPAFLARAFVYFAVWIIVSEILRRWSVRQDETGELRLTVMQRRLGAGALPASAIAMTFAAFDWLMSLDPKWSSTTFGVYWFAGSFLSTHALLILFVLGAERAGLLRGCLRPSHYHSLGKLMFAFVCFWAYIAFSQFMLIWIANVPDEVSWYLVRARGGFLVLALLLVFGQFTLPFFVLLSKKIKVRPAPLAIVAVWLLVMHYVDIYWLVMPAFDPGGPRPRWTDATALVGIGGSAIAFALYRLGGERVVPVGDPYLEESLRYEKP